MTVQPVFAQGVFLIKPDIYTDVRGFFYELYNTKVFKKKTGLDIKFVQDNLALSGQFVLRGFHFQKPPYQQAKLVSVLKGAVLDVIIDLRQDSPDYGKHFMIELNETNRYQLFIPRGFAHAYLSLLPDTLFYYKVDSFYHPDGEAGIRYDDPDLQIDWGYEPSRFILSEKDKKLPFIKDLK